MNPVALSEILKEIKDRHSLGDYGGKSPYDVETLEFCLLELESQIPRWIPKKERLPEKEGIYLVYEPWDYGVNALWFVLGMDGLPNSTTKKAWENVSHWHPLPKGPEE